MISIIIYEQMKSYVVVISWRHNPEEIPNFSYLEERSFKWPQHTSVCKCKW